MANQISFDQIPSDIRNPLFYAEVSNRVAGYYHQNSRALIIGQAVGAVASEAPFLVPSVDWVKTTYGAGSQLAVMVEAYRANNTYSELWILPLADAGGAVKASGTITVTGPATSSGTVSLYIADKLLEVPVASANTATEIAAAIVAEITKEKDLPVTAVNALGVVTVTAKNAGTIGNNIVMQVNFGGTLAGQELPAGVAITIVAMASGATNPTLSTKLAAIGSMDVAFYGHPYTDSTSLNTMRDYLADRWGPLVAQDGHAFTALSGTVSALQTVGLARNDENHTIVGYESTNPSWALKVLGAYLGKASQSLSIDPARTLQTLRLVTIEQPKEADQFTLSNRATLLNSGIATLMYNGASAQIERAITTYQLNSYGQIDPSYLDVTTRTALSYIKKSVGYRITQRYPRHKLAADATIFGAGTAIVTPKDIRAELIAWYDEMQQIGICQNKAGFENALLVQLDAIDPNRVNVLLPPTLINNLVVFATKVEFRLKV
jgi:phage tail sheath gpL-like